MATEWLGMLQTATTSMLATTKDCGSHILCCLLYTFHLCTNMDPRCASTSTKFGMSRFVGICDRSGLRYSQPAPSAPILCPLDGRHEILCTNDQHQLACILYTSNSILPCQYTLLCNMNVCPCHVICFGVQNECLYLLCNMRWCAK